jgi:3-isopropylmalate dehydrogenase
MNLPNPIHESPRHSDCIGPEPEGRERDRFLIGVLPGEGIGPEVTRCALDVLHALEKTTGTRFELRTGGVIGRAAESASGAALTDEVRDFCRSVFAEGGAILNGPGGGRYVYDLRRDLDLFLKISPLKPLPELLDAGRLKKEALRDVDIVMLRENVSGIYQGESFDERDEKGARVVRHIFSSGEPVLRRFLAAACRLAATRRGRLTVVYKESGLAAMSALWKDCALPEASAAGVDVEFMDVDHMAYQLVQDAARFDVIAAPNLCGDILADLGAVLLASRGLSYSGNFSPRREAVYQTNHGCAHDLAGKDSANPLAHILTLAMMLRESFNLTRESHLIVNAVRRALGAGWRTADIAQPGCRVIGMAEMGRRVAEHIGTALPLAAPATLA